MAQSINMMVSDHLAVLFAYLVARAVRKPLALADARKVNDLSVRMSPHHTEALAR